MGGFGGGRVEWGLLGWVAVDILLAAWGGRLDKGRTYETHFTSYAMLLFGCWGYGLGC